MSNEAPMRNILIVVTSHSHMAADRPTGLWLSEFTEPYALFRKEGCNVEVASIRGGEAPIDPGSLNATDDELVAQALRLLASTRPLESIGNNEFDAVFLPGGHGTMYDLPTDAIRALNAGPECCAAPQNSRHTTSRPHVLLLS